MFGPPFTFQTELVACENNEEDFVVINSVDGGVIVCYQILSLRKLLPALRISKKVSLRVDSNGVLSVNIIAEHDQDQDLVTFVEFLVGFCGHNSFLSPVSAVPNNHGSH